MDLIQETSTECIPDWELYGACIRCLHVLNTRDEINEAILQSDSVEYITSLISRKTTAVDALWSSILFFANLVYARFPITKKLFSKQLLGLVCTEMKKMDHATLFSYGCFFFNSMSVDDMGVRLDLLYYSCTIIAE